MGGPGRWRRMGGVAKQSHVGHCNAGTAHPVTVRKEFLPMRTLEFRRDDVTDRPGDFLVLNLVIAPDAG